MPEPPDLDLVAARWLRSLCTVRWATGLDHRGVPPGFHHHASDHHSLWWCRRGSVTLVTVGGSVALAEGRAALLPPYATRTESSPTAVAGASDWRLDACGIAVNPIDATPSPMAALALPAVWRPSDPLWAPLWERLLALRPRDVGADRCTAAALGGVLLWSAIRDLVDRDGVRSGPSPVWLGAVRRRLAGMREAPDLAELATFAGVSVNHLIRTFKAAHGCTPAAWSRRVRLDQAARLLTDLPDESIREIARRCGYRNLKAFTRAFGRRHGCPPRAWRGRRGDTSENSS